MKLLTKCLFGALALATAAIASPPPAEAAASFGFSFGVGPQYNYGPRPYRPYYRPYYRPAVNPCYGRFAPAYCGYPVFGRPVFIGNRWVREPLHYRTYRGAPQFWFGGTWRSGRW